MPPNQPDQTPFIESTELGSEIVDEESDGKLWIIVVSGAVLVVLFFGALIWWAFASSRLPANDGAKVNTTTQSAPSSNNAPATAATFAPQAGQSKTKVDADAAKDGRLPLCTATGTGSARQLSCTYTANSISKEVRVVFLNNVATSVQ